MMLIRRLISLFLFLILANVFVQARDSLVVKLDNQSVFKGYLLNQDNDSLYVGTLYDTDFRQYTGLWYKDGKNVFTLSFSGDSILLSNQEPIGINRMECYSPDRYNVSFGYGGTDSKYYDYKDGYWYTVDFGCKRYNKDSSILETVDDAVFMPIFHFLLVSFVLFLLLLPITGDDKEWLPTQYSLILSVLLIILYYVFTTEYIRLQLVDPMMTFSLLYLLRFFVSGLKYIIAHLVLAGIMLTFWSYFLFFNLEQVVCMSDSTPVNVKWQPGTSVFKRHIVKKNNCQSASCQSERS